MKAHVRNGRLLLDEPTEFPEGTELELVAAVDADDDLDDEERAALHAAIDEGLRQADAGETVDADEVFTVLERSARLA